MKTKIFEVDTFRFFGNYIITSKTIILLIIIANLSLACKSRQQAHKTSNTPEFLFATKEPWSAGHRSGGRGVEFRIYTRIDKKNEFVWKELQASDRVMEINSITISGDTCSIHAGWLSNTDDRYASEGVPEFSSAQLKFLKNGKEQSLEIPEFKLITSRPRP